MCYNVAEASGSLGLTGKTEAFVLINRISVIMNKGAAMDCKTAQKMVTPYIKRELKDRELEEFIDHIRDCQECYEELEIYFTIYFALQKLDEEQNVSYNIQKMLKDDLRFAERRVRTRKLARVWSAVLMVLAEAALVMILAAQSQSVSSEGLRDTYLFELFYGEPETEPEAMEETERDSEKAGENGKTPESKKPEKSGEKQTEKL